MDVEELPKGKIPEHLSKVNDTPLTVVFPLTSIRSIDDIVTVDAERIKKVREQAICAAILADEELAEFASRDLFYTIESGCVGDITLKRRHDDATVEIDGLHGKIEVTLYAANDSAST